MDVTVVVAGIGSVGLVGASFVTAVGNRKFLKQNVGSTNGNGSIASMTESLLVIAKSHDKRLETLEVSAVESTRDRTAIKAELPVYRATVAKRIDEVQASIEGRGGTNPPT